MTADKAENTKWRSDLSDIIKDAGGEVLCEKISVGL